PEVATFARDLTIRLHSPFPPEALRFCMLSCMNVVDLILILPRNAFGDVLVDLQFHRLQLFKTNLPHRFLPEFLASHPTVTNLCLGSCNPAPVPDEPCPLRLVDLRHVETVECALECALATAHPALLRLTVEHLGDPCPRPPTVLRLLQSPLVTLFALTLDFFPDDYEMLDQIVRAAPRVQKLKLLEKPCTYRRDGLSRPSRRMWNHATRWARSLFRLEHLEDLALRTASTFVRVPSSVANEKRTVVKWTTKTSRPSRSTVRKDPHPTLTSVRVWYRCEEPGGGILTNWSKYSGSWRNIARMSDPQPDELF
ncbi:hypothetical protein C8Q76DRAFT_635134, partial [Earliella scabrosa]